MCFSCSASAILAANVFADNGGPGYFESMRGNGFISNLVCVDKESEENFLWKDIWLNVLQTNFFNNNQDENLFLWMESVPDDEEKRKNIAQKLQALTEQIDQLDLDIKKTNDKKKLIELKENKKEIEKIKRLTQQARKDITGIYPEEAHPLQVYWAWMRRVYLNIERDCIQLCCICNKHKIIAKSIFKTNKSYNFPKAYWQHPLSAYKKVESGDYEGKFLALEMTSQGLPYIYWNDFIKTSDNQFTAQVVTEHLKKSLVENKQLILWSFGFAMNSNSPLGWYESKTPFYLLDDIVNRQSIEREIDKYIKASNKIADSKNGYLINAIKNAWFDENKEKNKDQKKAFHDNRAIEIGKIFMDKTHEMFFVLIDKLYKSEGKLDVLEVIIISTDWYRHIRKEAENLFSYWAFKSNIQTNPKRISLAHKQLMQNLNSYTLKQEILGLNKEQVND